MEEVSKQANDELCEFIEGWMRKHKQEHTKINAYCFEPTVPAKHKPFTLYLTSWNMNQQQQQEN